MPRLPCPIVIWVFALEGNLVKLIELSISYSITHGWNIMVTILHWRPEKELVIPEFLMKSADSSRNVE